MAMIIIVVIVGEIVLITVQINGELVRYEILFVRQLCLKLTNFV